MMQQRFSAHAACLIGAVTFLLAGVYGCSKSDEGKSLPHYTKPKNPDTGHKGSETVVLKLHWLGKKRLSAEANATNFMSIWNMPESAKLEAQTLDKLSTAPWRLLKTTTPLSNAPSTLLRPLLDDLIQEESYVEIFAITNQPRELVFAIRLPADRAALWQTNFPIILQSLPTPASSLVLSRSGEWTLLALNDSRLTADFVSRIQRDSIPFVARTNNYWLELDADITQIGTIFGINASLPHLALSVAGDGLNVHTLGMLNFPAPVSIELDPWNIPTNLVHDPLIGFMAVRGIRPWLNLFKIWDESRFGPPPNQAFFWAQNGTAPLHFFAFPSKDAVAQFSRISDFLIKDVNPMMVMNTNLNVRYGEFVPAGNASRLKWRGVPFMYPNIGAFESGQNAFIEGGFFQNLATNRPPPDDLIKQFQADTNIIFYDSEISQQPANRMIQIGQVLRFVFGQPGLSMTNNAALPWMVAVSPKLRMSATVLKLAGPTQMTFRRTSTIGINGFEIHLLAEWLESPSFPIGLYSLESSR